MGPPVLVGASSLPHVGLELQRGVAGSGAQDAAAGAGLQGCSPCLRASASNSASSMAPLRSTSASRNIRLSEASGTKMPHCRKAASSSASEMLPEPSVSKETKARRSLARTCQGGRRGEGTCHASLACMRAPGCRPRHMGLQCGQDGLQTGSTVHCGAQPGTLGCRPGSQAWVAGLGCRRAAHLFAHARLAPRACSEVDGCLLGRGVREQRSCLLRHARELFKRELA